jgi:multisubunit Na+/H+ antiporter MnhG subunit
MEFKGRPIESGLPNWVYTLIAILGIVSFGWLLLAHSQALGVFFGAILILLLLIIISPFLLKAAARVVRSVKKAGG